MKTALHTEVWNAVRFKENSLQQQLDVRGLFLTAMVLRLTVHGGAERAQLPMREREI